MECPDCRRPVSAGQAFCGHCGARSAAGRADGPRLVVTLDDEPAGRDAARSFSAPAPPTFAAAATPSASTVATRYLTTPVNRTGREQQVSAPTPTPAATAPVPYGATGFPAPGFPGVPVPSAVVPSTPGRRLGALLLDLLLIFVTLSIGWLVWMMISWSKGASPAQSLLGMRVVDLRTGRAATWGGMFVRNAVCRGLLGALTLGVTTFVGGLMIFGPTRQALWDRMAHTVVVDDPHGVTLARF